jgi:hypothetical protein
VAKGCEHELRLKVELCVDIPIERYRGLNKKTLRSKEVQVDGALWHKAYGYCRRCGCRVDLITFS